MEKTNVPSRTVELAASELPTFFNALPRLVTENLTVRASGTLNEYLYLQSFYGCGSIWIEGDGGCVFQKGTGINACRVSVTLKNLEFSGRPETHKDIVLIQNSKYVSMQGCTVRGTGPNPGSSGNNGVRAALCSMVMLADCSIMNCNNAMLASSSSIVTVYNEQDGGFSGSSTGVHLYHGGIVMLSGKTPDLLGGNANTKNGGLIVKANGTLL